MLKLVAILALVALCAAQKSHDGNSVVIQEPAPVEFAQSGGIISDVVKDVPVEAALPELAEETIEAALPEVAAEHELINIPAPAVDLAAPEIHLGKETPEIIDVPHVPINLPASKIENTDLHIEVPSPVIESPKPIFKNKPTIFKVPQPIIEIPQPMIQHVPVYYRVPHRVQVPNHEFQTQPYVANPVPYPVLGNRYVQTAEASKTVGVGKALELSSVVRPRFSFSLNFKPSSGKTIVRHYNLGNKK